MFFTWKTVHRITCMTSTDGFNWTGPLLTFLPQLDLFWEEEVSQPCVIYRNQVFEMWYTATRKERGAFSPGERFIAHAISADGMTWQREREPCFKSQLLWEQYSISHPCVIFDEESRKYRMWYSAGEFDFPNVIGYAQSDDGLNWIRTNEKPILVPKPAHKWERVAVSGCDVKKLRNFYVMAYCGFEHITNSRLCFARSTDGINWEAHHRNPIITGGKQGWWDAGYTTKASLVFDEGAWKMWYTGNFNTTSNIGLMTHAGPDLGFRD